MSYSVMIVEDDPMVSSINQRYVEKIPGFTVNAVVPTTKEALQLTAKHNFDLLLVDIHLSNNSGLDLIRQLRKKGYPADFIMITAKKEQETIQLCAQYGAIDYILKPFLFERFEKSLLRFKHQKELLFSTDIMNQEDIDEFYWTQNSSIDEGFSELEKGLTRPTLQLILNVIDSFEEAFTIEDLTEKTSLSHVSIRKYIRYLEEQEILRTRQKYGTVGRPTTYYEKID